MKYKNNLLERKKKQMQFLWHQPSIVSLLAYDLVYIHVFEIKIKLNFSTLNIRKKSLNPISKNVACHAKI